ncbi:hypothetical protein [Candidatus Poriferisodalis sp.]|uniref:hypothetical protein n=1 Tax=Candidatus Poriferisodalis sp. TaxID=3101277 RepID=UPI003B02455F
MAAVSETATEQPSAEQFGDPHAEEAIKAALAAVAGPGSFFTGTERLAMAARARVARGLADAETDLPPIVAATVDRVAVDAIATRPSHIEAWRDDGRDALAYVELVSVVSQICGIDSYRVGLGAGLDPLPAPVVGEPVPAAAEGAAKANAWVPTVGIALAPTALSALPRENATKAGLGAAWYITDKVIHQYDVEPGRELTRPQMELVAARTSWLNECFF